MPDTATVDVAQAELHEDCPRSALGHDRRGPDHFGDDAFAVRLGREEVCAVHGSPSSLCQGPVVARVGVSSRASA